MPKAGLTPAEPVGMDLPKNLFGYDVIDYLGEGAGSLIYAVSDPATRQVYALKHVVRRTDRDVRFLNQIATEYEVARQFTHPGLRRAITLKENRTLLRKVTEAGLVLEMYDGVAMDASPSRSPRALLDTFIHVAGAMAGLHALGYIHCDLKPNNILLGSHHREVKVIDFGQAVKSGTIKERIQGTPDYISPEQVKRDPVTVRTDVFNLGATMYWAATRRTIPTLFKLEKADNSFLLDDCIPSPRELNPEMPETLSNLIMECVRTNPARRPTDMPEVARRLEIIRHAVTRNKRPAAISA